MKNRLYFWQLFFWIEELLFERKTTLQKTLSLFLYPLSLIWCAAVIIKKKLSNPEDLGVKVISVGNLTLGGSGKTPVVMALAQDCSDCAVVLRGYKRKSEGLQIVSDKGQILLDVSKSGDEAMMIAKSLTNATVIVSGDRKAGILKAKELGAQTVFLDDGFGKFGIKKIDILLKAKEEPKNIFCLPAGCYRYPRSFYRFADIVLSEQDDFRRISFVKNKTNTMVFVTAISRPQRLEPFLPKEVVQKVYFPDHANFDENALKTLLASSQADGVLVTEKDLVKMEGFSLPISVLKLKIELMGEKAELLRHILKPSS